jgi:hypothetical protein
MSKPAFDKTMPVKPPIVNKIKKPNENKKGTVHEIKPCQIVAIQLNTLIPVGTAIIIVAAIK